MLLVCEKQALSNRNSFFGLATFPVESPYHFETSVNGTIFTLAISKRYQLKGIQ